MPTLTIYDPQTEVVLQHSTLTQAVINRMITLICDSPDDPHDRERLTLLVLNDEDPALVQQACSLCGDPLSDAEKRLAITAHFGCIMAEAFGKPPYLD